MTTIDHKILIPASPQAVWDFISTIENNAEWQTDCDNLSFLSQKRRGVGTRWRNQSPTRQAAVFEITTWYDGIGYEYVFIDGAPYKSARGRIRLQEIAEGTFVQWTFTYELGGGLLGDLRDTLSAQRRHSRAMTDSLKALWKTAKRTNSLEGYEARSLMRDGLQDPEERAQYATTRQQPDETSTSTTLESVVAASTPIITEPPISDDDTRPRPALQVEPPTEDDKRFAPPVTPTSEPEPTTDKSMFSPPPKPVVPEPEPATDKSMFSPPPKPVAPEPGPATDKSMFSPPPKPVAPEPEPTANKPLVVPPPKPVAPEPEPTANKSLVVPPPPPIEDFKPKVPADKDTSEMSIWEVFGIPSPTDTQRMKAIRAAEEAEAEYTQEEAQTVASTPMPTTVSDNHTTDTPPQKPSAWGRTGFRARARQQSVKLRRPGR